MVTTTVILLRGGAGGIGVLEVSGWLGTRNFLIHTGKLFAASGFNFAMTIKSSDALRIWIAAMPEPASCALDEIYV